MSGKPLASCNLPLNIYDAPEVPERNLLAAVLSRCICDILNPPQLEGGKSDFESPKWARSAASWLRSNARGDFTFLWVCQYLDLNPNEIRRVVRQYKAKGVRFEPGLCRLELVRGPYKRP